MYYFEFYLNEKNEGSKINFFFLFRISFTLLMMLNSYLHVFIFHLMLNLFYLYYSLKVVLNNKLLLMLNTELQEKLYYKKNNGKLQLINKNSIKTASVRTKMLKNLIEYHMILAVAVQNLGLKRLFHQYYVSFSRKTSVYIRDGLCDGVLFTLEIQNRLLCFSSQLT